MIKITKIKKKNPELADFKKYDKGYHVTKESGLSSIEKSGFLKSNGEARRALSANAISVNKEKVTEAFVLTPKDMINNQFVLLQSGKKNYFVLRVK